jgi:hypothetical protein
LLVSDVWEYRIQVSMIQVGQRVHDRGRNAYGDGITIGYVVRVEQPDADGVAHVVVLTDTQPAQPKRRSPAIIIHHQDGRKGAYQQLGPVARLERIALEEVDPASLSHYSDHHALWAAARKALFAAAVASLPGYRHRNGHGELIEAWRALRDAAIEKERGIE